MTLHIRVLALCATAALANSPPLFSLEIEDSTAAVKTFDGDCNSVSALAFSVLGESGIEVKLADPKSVSIEELWDGGFGLSRSNMCSTCYALRQRRTQGGTWVELRDPGGKLVSNAWKAIRLYTLPVRGFGLWYSYSSFVLTGGTIRFEERNRRQCEIALQHHYGFEGIVWFVVVPLDGGFAGTRSNGRFETELLSKIERQLANRPDGKKPDSQRTP